MKKLQAPFAANVSFIRSALLFGIGMAGLQVALALWSAPGPGFAQRYASLCQWDCATWYESIARNGYHSSVPPVRQNPAAANVAFFPAHPLLAGAISRKAGIPVTTSLLLVSQIFCVLFWAALWSLLRRWKIPAGLSGAVLLGVAAHPAAWFLVSGYSESMFLGALVLFLLSSSDSSRLGLLLSGGAGALMSATRIIGLPVAIFPVLRNVLAGSRHSRGTRPIGRAILVSAFASLGTLGFLLYCQLRFGSYSLYMDTQRIGWGVLPDYTAIATWGTFKFLFPIDRIATLGSAQAFLAIGALELFLWGRGWSKGFRMRLPVYLTAFGIFITTISGLKSVKFMSMIRYSLPYYVLILICVAHALARVPRLPGRLTALAVFGFAVFLLLMISRVQLPALQAYLLGQWFA